MSTRTMNLSFIRAEGLAYEIGILNGDIQKGFLACGTIVGDGTLNEMARVIEFMRVYLLPSVAAPPSAQSRTFVGHTRSQIAVRLLSLGNDVNNRVEIVIELGIIVHSERIAGTLDNLIGIGIIE